MLRLNTFPQQSIGHSVLVAENSTSMGEVSDSEGLFKKTTDTTWGYINGYFDYILSLNIMFLQKCQGTVNGRMSTTAAGIWLEDSIGVIFFT